MKLEKKSILSILFEVKKEYNFQYSLCLAFEEYTVRIHMNSEKLFKELRKYFQIFITERENITDEIYAAETSSLTIGDDISFKERKRSGGKKIKEAHCDIDGGRIIYKLQTGMYFITGENCNCALGPCNENPNQVVNFINNRFIEYKLNQNSLLFHAAGVANKHEGLALVGTSGAGKSTLALHMMKYGLSFVSNDRLMVEKKHKNLVMTGVAKYPRINPGTIVTIDELKDMLSDKRKNELLAMPQKELWELEEKYDLFLEEIYGENRFQLSADMKALVILNWDRSLKNDPDIKKIKIKDRPDLYPTFMKSPGLFYQTAKNDYNEKTPAEYTKLLEKCDVYEVSGGVDFHHTARYFSELLSVSEI